jgi:hypothetical protein
MAILSFLKVKKVNAGALPRGVESLSMKIKDYSPVSHRS